MTNLPDNPCIAVVVAAGRGTRAGGEMPKQYQKIAGVPIVRMAIENLLNHPHIDAICPVIHRDDEELFAEATLGLTMLPVLYGGATRQESVCNGLAGIAHMNPDCVLIHDAARPCPSVELVSRVIDGLDSVDGVVPALPVIDTLKRGNDDNRVTATVSRDSLWRAQTPQGFRFELILDAHKQCAGQELTDDAAIAETAGLVVKIVEGDERNLKVTTPEDVTRVHELLHHHETRTGMGYDVHRFCDGNSVHICGVDIPHDKALLGHSDADVGMHALCDAIYGAIGEGDIGVHFPPSDEQWRNARSDVFLSHAAGLVRVTGGHIINVDVTIVCERPVINPHRDTMRARLADVLMIDVSRVSVKATTTERLGFTGRDEGIAAQAVATVSMPVTI